MSKNQGTSGMIAGGTERAPEGTEGANVVPPAKRRWTAARKVEAVLCVLRGQSLESVSRKYAIGLHGLSQWRDKVLAGAENALKTGEPDDSGDTEKRALLSKIGEITMANELLEEKIRRLENGIPFHLRR
jgi:transposase-like protein